MCSTCSCDPCNCTQPQNCQQCECVDHGVIASGRYIEVLDYRMCPKRLTNAPGFLVAELDGNGNYQIKWSASPCVLPEALTISEGTTFANILAALGDQGCMRRIVPDAAADGYVRALNGAFVIGDIPTVTVPDPLTLNTPTVSTQATIKNLTITGAFCFPAVPAGTIAIQVGLDDDGCMVKQTSGANPLGISVAMFYENTGESSTATPNIAITNGQYAIIGNELFDSDSIAQVQDQYTVKILVAGKYLVRWMGAWNMPVGSDDRLANLNLELNGSTTIPGTGSISVRASGANPREWQSTHGETVLTLAVNDTLKLPVTGTAISGGTSGGMGLVKTKLILQKFQS